MPYTATINMDAREDAGKQCDIKLAQRVLVFLSISLQVGWPPLLCKSNCTPLKNSRCSPRRADSRAEEGHITVRRKASESVGGRNHVRNAFSYRSHSQLSLVLDDGPQSSRLLYQTKAHLVDNSRAFHRNRFKSARRWECRSRVAGGPRRLQCPMDETPRVTRALLVHCR